MTIKETEGVTGTTYIRRSHRDAVESGIVEMRGWFQAGPISRSSAKGMDWEVGIGVALFLEPGYQGLSLFMDLPSALDLIKQLTLAVERYPTYLAQRETLDFGSQMKDLLLTCKDRGLVSEEIVNSIEEVLEEGRAGSN